MDRNGFIDEVNPAYIAFALLGGIISFIMTKRVEGLGMFWKVLTPIATIVVIYGYLAMTDR